MELGAHKVQGIDYAYTLQGWLKGINSNLLAPTVDMGRDGDLTDADPSNDLIGRDAYGLSLGYYGAEDYKAIGPQWSNIDGRPFAPIGPGGTLSDEHRPLYNGNIAHTVNTLQPFGLWNSGNGAQGQVLAQVYQYDQLNRLKQARGVEGLTTNNRWQTVTDAQADRYRSTYTYDANGNITAAERWDRDGNQYDDFSYKYEQRGGRLERNRLYQLYDLADAGNLLVNEANGAKDIAYTGDVPFAPEATNINGAYNYRYDQLGNLAKDVREGIDTIQWTVAGKVKQVEKTDGTVLTFAYGADGHRLWKEVTPPVLDDTGYREYYIRDAQGNIMATYRSQLITVPSPEPQGYAASLRVTERPVYGSSRLGTYARWEELYDHPVVSTPAPDPVQQVDLNYELTDHLGNVTAVVTGRLLNGNGGGTPKQAELVNAQGYEAFGSLLPGRNYSSGSYRYLFQGQEHDDEINGSTGTNYAFEYRMHDPRVGRFLSIDPLSRKYPFYTPYSFSGNRVIDSREIEGLEPRQEIYGPDKLVPVLVIPASSTIQVPVHPGGLDYLKDKGPTPEPPLTWRQKAQLVDLVLPIEFWSNVLDGENLDGSKATFGGAMLNSLGFVPIPGFKQMGLLRRAKFGDEFIDIVERTVKNSNGDDVVRSFVKSEDDLLKIADDAAGGSLDNFKEIKPGFYEGEVNGVRRKIEWQPGGEPHMGHGPHVKIMDWNPKAGKIKADGTPAGKWEVKSRYELDSE